MGTIKVTGKALRKISPDQTRISLNLEGIDAEYGAAVGEMSRKTEELRTLLTKFGFDRSDLKTLDVNVRPKYESYQVEVKTVQSSGAKTKGRTKKTEKSYRTETRFVGYAYSHRMKVEFGADHERLGKVLYALAHCEAKPKVEFDFGVADPDAATNELLAAAAADAREKAEMMTRAAGAELREIKRIGDPDGDEELCEAVRRRRSYDSLGPLCDCASGRGDAESYAVAVVPEDIVASVEVDVVWEIG